MALAAEGGTSFWTHLGRNPVRILQEPPSGGSGSMATNKCLFTCHGVKTIDDALALLDSWYGPQHVNGVGGRCKCDGCTRSGACLDPLACRIFLHDLMDVKDAGKWDRVTYPDIPDDLRCTASSTLR